MRQVRLLASWEVAVKWARVSDRVATSSLRWAIVAMSSRGDFEVVSWHESEEAALEEIGAVMGEWFSLSVVEVRSEWVRHHVDRSRATVRAISQLAIEVVTEKRGRL